MTQPTAGFALPPPLSLGELYKQSAGRPGKTQQVALAKKGAPWSDEEHKAFLTGLKVYGRGQWKQISRYYVPSRTPTQVASHAQKHFLRQSGAQKRRSRFSAVEEAAMAAVAPAPPALLHHAVGLVAPGSAVPGLYGRSLAGGSVAPPAAPFGLLPQQQTLRLPAAAPLAPGMVRGGIALGTPIGVLPPLPSITTASGTELPILPVMPGRINAQAVATAPPLPAPTATLSTFSGDSSGSEPLSGSKPASPAPSLLGSGTAGTSAAVGRSTAALYAPSGRSGQLLRLLELNEQLTGGGTAAAAAHLQPGAMPHCRTSLSGSGVPRVPSATAALDALALLAEAEAQSDEEAQRASKLPAHSADQPASDSVLAAPTTEVGSALPAAAHSPQAPLVSAF